MRAAPRLPDDRRWLRRLRRRPGASRFDRDVLATQFREAYRRRSGRTADLLVTRPADGAGIIRSLRDADGGIGASGPDRFEPRPGS